MNLCGDKNLVGKIYWDIFFWWEGLSNFLASEGDLPPFPSSSRENPGDINPQHTRMSKFSGYV